jgi:hypothetical protein
MTCREIDSVGEPVINSPSAVADVAFSPGRRSARNIYCHRARRHAPERSVISCTNAWARQPAGGTTIPRPVLPAAILKNK